VGQLLEGVQLPQAPRELRRRAVAVRDGLGQGAAAAAGVPEREARRAEGRGRGGEQRELGGRRRQGQGRACWAARASTRARSPASRLMELSQASELTSPYESVNGWSTGIEESNR